MFNTLAMTKRLEDSGVPRSQAEAHVQVLAELVDGELATKTDIKRDLKELEYRLVFKLSAIMGTMITILGVVSAIYK